MAFTFNRHCAQAVRRRNPTLKAARPLYGALGSQNTAKSGQNGPGLDQQRFTKGPLATGKGWQSVFLVTKIHFASLCHGLFECRGGRAAFSVGLRRRPACVQCRLTAKCIGIWCHGLVDYIMRLAGTRRSAQTRIHPLKLLYFSFILR